MLFSGEGRLKFPQAFPVGKTACLFEQLVKFVAVGEIWKKLLLVG